jgi:hypothetical protein
MCRSTAQRDLNEEIDHTGVRGCVADTEHRPPWAAASWLAGTASSHALQCPLRCACSRLAQHPMCVQSALSTAVLYMHARVSWHCCPLLPGASDAVDPVVLAQ